MVSTAGGDAVEKCVAGGGGRGGSGGVGRGEGRWCVEDEEVRGEVE